MSKQQKSSNILIYFMNFYLNDHGDNIDPKIQRLFFLIVTIILSTTV